MYILLFLESFSFSLFCSLFLEKESHKSIILKIALVVANEALTDGAAFPYLTKYPHPCPPKLPDYGLWIIFMYF